MGKPKLPTYPLIFPQQGVWLAERILTRPDTTLCWMVKVGGDSDVGSWIQAINQVVNENEGLRLRMAWRNGQMSQYLAPVSPVCVPFIDFAGPISAQEYPAWLDREIRARLLMINSPLFSFSVLRLGNEDYRLLMKVHHIVVDGWSMTVITDQVMNHYRALHLEEPLNQPGSSYLAYIRQQLTSRSRAMNHRLLRDTLERYKKAQPAIRIRPSSRDSSRKTGQLIFPLSPDFIARVTRFSQGCHASVYLFFLTSIILYIWLVNSSEHVAIGTAFHNRLKPAYQNSVGLFASVLPLCIQMKDDLRFSELIRRVFAAWKQGIQSQPSQLSWLGFAVLYPYLEKLFDIVFEYESCLIRQPVEWFSGVIGLKPHSIRIGILDYMEAGGRIEFNYLAERYSSEDITQIFTQLEELWEQLLADPEKRIGELRHS